MTYKITFCHTFHFIPKFPITETAHAFNTKSSTSSKIPMASRLLLFKVALTSGVVAMLIVCTASQSNNCQTAIVSLAPCLSYITGNSSTPASSCCSQLATVVQSEPQCLCTVLSGDSTSQMGININQTQALALPGACNVQTPPVSDCKKVAGPNASPTTPSQPSSPSTPSTPGGAKATQGTSAGSSTKISFSFIFLAILLVSFA